MARDFDGNDSVQTVGNVDRPVAVTLSIWAYSDTNDATQRRIIAFSGGSAMTIFQTNGDVRFQRAWSSSPGGVVTWSCTGPSTGAWAHLLITYDGSSTGNDPVMYVNGSSQTVSEGSAPSGTLGTTAGGINIGNNNALTLGYDGRLAEAAIWNRVLSAGEIAALAGGAAPAHFPQGMILYNPLIRETHDYVAGAVTTNGGAVADHPRIHYPHGVGRVLSRGATDQSITAALLGPTSTLYGATVAASGSATISAAFLGPTSALYGATVAAGGDVTISAAFIPSGATLYGASIVLTYELAAAFLSSGSTLYGATVAATGDVAIGAALIPSGATLYGATISEVFEIAAAFLDSGAVLYGASFRETSPPAVWIPRRRAFRVVIYAPLPSTERIDLFDLNPDITSLRYRTGVPGGFTTLEVGYPDDNLPRQGVLLRRAVTPPRARVQLWEGAFLAHEGLIESGSGPGALFGISSTGYGLAGLVDSYISSADATASTAGEILRQVIGSAAPTLRTGASQEWRDSGVAHTLGEMHYRTPQAIVEQLTREGGIANLGNRVWDWTVYEDRRARFLPRDTPTNPRYLIPLEGPPWLEWNENYTNMYSSAAVLYTVAGVETLTATATTEGFVQRWGFERTALLTMGETTATAAATYRDTWLAMHAEPEYSIVVTRTDDRGLEMPGGATYPAHLVRAGEADGWVQIGTGMPNDPVLPIIGTEYDAATRTARYELGTPNVFDITENMAEVCRETSNLSRWIHPLTGTRTRA